jgi:polyisoprenoid-binding protein YceI
MTSRTLFTAAVAAALPALAAAAETFQVDPVHSSVNFRVKHMNVSYSYGRFNAISGTFTLDPTDPAKSAFEFNVRADSLDTGSPKRDGHLKSPDFFNVRQYPSISFKSKSVASAGENAYDVTGDLTLHGVTRPVTLKVEQTGKGPGMAGRGAAAGLLTTFNIKRSDFGMKGMVGPVGDDVRVEVAIEGNHR